jgi:uncharacterized membrane protein
MPLLRKSTRSDDNARLSLWDKLKLARLINSVMFERLKSRKLWVAVLGAALLTLGQGIGLDADLLDKLITLAMTYIGAQGLVDTAAALKGSH